MNLKNTILSVYLDKERQMIAMKSSMANVTSSVKILHRTLFPTRSNKFNVIELDEAQLDKIVNNTLAKPYSINLGLTNLIVDKTLQFIVDNDSNYIMIELPNEPKVMNFFKESLINLYNTEDLSKNRSCNHRDVDGSILVDEENGIAKCKQCGETFRVLDESHITNVENSADTLVYALNTIKLADPSLTKDYLIKIGDLINDIESIPSLLSDSLSKLNNF